MTRLRIEVRRGDEVAPGIEPDGDVVRIGRAEGNDVRVDAGGVAAFHALLLRHDDEVLLQDLGGGETAIRRSGELLPLGEQESRRKLLPGDVIVLGAAEGTPGGPALLRIVLEPDDDAPRVVQVRAIESLPQAKDASLGGDPTLRAIWEVQRAVGAGTNLQDVLAAVLDGAL